MATTAEKRGSLFQRLFCGRGQDTGLRSANERVAAFVSLYGSKQCSASHVLCDRHDPKSIAYTIVRNDKSVQELTYGELKAASERFASVLASLGVKAGDRVATLMGKSREYLITLLGIWRLGAVHVPLFTAFAPPAIALRLLGSCAKVVICDTQQEPKLAPGEDMPVNAPWRIISTGGAPGDGKDTFAGLMSKAPAGAFQSAALGGEAPFIHIYTSGTTGAPKGVVVPIHALAAFHAYAEFGLDIRSSDRFWCAADPGWAYGLYCGIIASYLTGVPSVLLEGAFSPDSTFEVLASQRVTNFAAAPTVYRALRSHGGIECGAARLKLRCASSAGEPLTPDVNAWAAKALGVEVHDHYGQTEMGMLINNHHNPLLKRPVKPGSMGQAMPGWKAIVLDTERDQPVDANKVGRIAIDISQSPLAFFSGYHNDPLKSAEKFAGNGRWYLTGDTGSVDEAGYFHFSSRDDDVIIMAGYRIGPFEVESVIMAHPAVAECAVVAAPDEIRGEVVEAHVVLAPSHIGSPELAREIQQWVKTHYAAHAYPRSVHFLTALPKTPSGKIQRFLLKRRERNN